MSPQNSSALRTSIGFPVERHQQLKSIANLRGVTVAGLIEGWISSSMAAGEIPDEMEGFQAIRSDDVIAVVLAGRPLPFLTAQKAILLATLLDVAAGTVNSVHEFKLPTGRAVSMELGAVSLGIARRGTGVAFVLRDHAKDTSERFTTPTSYATDLARMIRTATH